MVSIVMPSLNQARFLRAALESVLGQSYQDLELIVADGGSTDGSVDILRSWAEKDTRLRWAASPDTGPASAINQAVRSARGDIIGWLNADDLYTQDAVGSAQRTLQDNPALEMVYGEAIFIDELGDTKGRYPTKQPDVPLQFFADGCFICQPTVFLRREAWDKLGGLDETLATAFDFDLWIRVFQRWPGRIGFVDRVQAGSRQHADTITATKRRSVALEAVTILKHHLDLTPAHWILTHIEEIMAAHPDGSGRSLQEKIGTLLQEASMVMKPDDFHCLQTRIAHDRRIPLAGPHSFIDVYPDGWAGPRLTARFDRKASRGLRLKGSSGLPPKSKHKIEIRESKCEIFQQKLSGQADFELLLRPAGNSALPVTTMEIASNKAFRPCDNEPGSTDARELSFRVHSAEEML